MLRWTNPVIQEIPNPAQVNSNALQVHVRCVRADTWLMRNEIERSLKFFLEMSSLPIIFKISNESTACSDLTSSVHGLSAAVIDNPCLLISKLRVIWLIQEVR